ncbi:MAG: bifunctional metallophosphatase/5'-nucleotidase, partial [Butyricicoccus sp.]|nr:bifunctional metallophosphatase/5'-nucleotidase [Butyricicoccus sp.]
APALADAPTAEAVILFTHDMHSHLLPATDETGAQYGGYARLKTAVDAVKAENPDAIYVDGGDFSMGSLFQTAYAGAATELRVMGELGCDATTFGNHEYDYRAAGLASMLNAAVDSGDPLPAIVECNYLPPSPGEQGYGADAQAVWDAFDRYDVSDYILLERGGVWYAILGVMGVDSDACAPMSGMILHDRFERTQQAVDAAKAQCWEENGQQPLVICLSHSGTSDGKGEDYELAQKVSGINLIVSGHTHTTLAEPIEVNGTWIVSAGEYSKNLGVATMDCKPNGDTALSDYRLIPIDDTLADDPEIAALVEDYKKEVDENYLSRFGLSFDEVLAYNPYTFDSVDEVYATRHESTLGNLFSDAYKRAAEQATGERVDMALTASGVIRESFAMGDVTVSDVFNAASLGIGADGVPGYPLIAVYITGADLKNAVEVDASVSQLMKAARLYFSGVSAEYNTNRMFFNKTMDAALVREDGGLEEIDDGALYRVVTGLYCGQMLGAAEKSSYGLLTITARDADGVPIDMDNLEDCIIHDAEGNEVKEWYAIASYLQSMGGEVDVKYSKPDGRKTVEASWRPDKLLKNPNKFTLIAAAVIVVLTVAVVLIVRAAVRKVKKRGGKKK